MLPVVPPIRVSVSPYAPVPTIRVRFRFLRDGEVTPELKKLRVFRSWYATNKLDMVFEAAGDEWSQPYVLSLTEMLAQGEWLVGAIDNTPPKRTRAVYMSFLESADLVFNITSGEGGGGGGGTPATVPGVVRVDQQPANREIVIVERPSTGEWRLAGYGPTPGGSNEIDVRITDGPVYALGLDDWGIQFAPSLAVDVGQRVRPTRFAGWVYEITEAGTLPATEPQWWPMEGDNPSRPLGTARAVARRYYRPQALGPIRVEIPE